MVSKNYLVSRDGKTKMVHYFVKHLDGTLWSDTEPTWPLLDSCAPEFVSLGKDKIMVLVESKQWDKIPAGCFAREGLNPSGLMVKSFDDIRAEEQAARTPAQVERDRISRMFYEADKLANTDRDDNVDGPMAIRAEACEALAQWRQKYPDAAREEDARELETEAEEMEEKAKRALFYDSDGWLSDNEQLKRRDEYLAQAQTLYARAKAIRQGVYESGGTR